MRFMNPTMGKSRRYALLSLPFKMGINSAPRINMMAGGTVLIIVILFSLYDGPQYIFCGENEDHKGNKAEYCIKSGPLLPPEIGMFMNKKLRNE
jgi:hypothetical protein